MSSIYLIDFYASSGCSFFHRRHVIGKFIGYLLLLLTTVFTSSLYRVGILLIVALTLLFIAGIPLKQALKWAAYPAFFALIFALAQLGSGLLPYLTLARAVTAALFSIFFFTTTPFPEFLSIFSGISKGLVSFLLFSYRFFFLLLSTVEKKLRIMKLRGGMCWKRLPMNLAKLAGFFFVDFIDRSETIYQTVALRGFTGQIFITSNKRFQFTDLIFIVGILFLISGLLWI